MIKNERQYKITKSQIAKFEAALDELAARSGAKSRLRKLEEDSLQSQLDELRNEVKQYEQLQSGGRKPIHIDSFDELPRALVEARIVAGLSQKDLAERLELKEQQIQRYEATDYCSASLTRLKEIAKALGVNIVGKMTYSG
ncbi:MAG: helix-turn-helix domain-containing protein [Planctomycetota bacterium]